MRLTVRKRTRKKVGINASEKSALYVCSRVIRAEYIVSPWRQRPNIALQRTPLARPVGWARFLAVVPCRQPCRFRRLPAAPLKAGVGPLIVVLTPVLYSGSSGIQTHIESLIHEIGHTQRISRYTRFP